MFIEEHMCTSTVWDTLCRLGFLNTWGMNSGIIRPVWSCLHQFIHSCIHLLIQHVFITIHESIHTSEDQGWLRTKQSCFFREVYILVKETGKSNNNKTHLYRQMVINATWKVRQGRRQGETDRCIREGFSGGTDVWAETRMKWEQQALFPSGRRELQAEEEQVQRQPWCRKGSTASSLGWVAQIPF